MEKKKVIKIVTATAIAASAFTAVAPAQSEAASSLDSQIKAAKAKMIKPYNKYTKSTTLASVKTVKVYVDQAKKAQKDINAKINKSKLSKSAKAKKLAEVKAYAKYITRSEGYLKGYSQAVAAQKQLNTLYAALETAVEAKDVAEAQKQYDALQAAITKAKKDITKTVYGAKVETLLFKQFINPTEAKVAAGVEKVIAALEEVKKVEAYVALANGDLKDEAAIKAAKDAKAKIDVTKLSDADKANVEAADKKVAAAEEALQVPAVVIVEAMNAKELAVTFNKAVDATDAAIAGKYAVEGETIAKAEVSEDGKTVILTTVNELKVTNAKVTVAPIKTKADAKVLTAEYNVLFTFADKTPVSVQSVEAKGTEAVITFNEPVQNAGTVSLNGVALTSGYTLRW